MNKEYSLELLKPLSLQEILIKRSFDTLSNDSKQRLTDYFFDHCSTIRMTKKLDEDAEKFLRYLIRTLPNHHDNISLDEFSYKYQIFKKTILKSIANTSVGIKDICDIYLYSKIKGDEAYDLEKNDNKTHLFKQITTDCYPHKTFIVIYKESREKPYMLSLHSLFKNKKALEILEEW